MKSAWTGMGDMHIRSNGDVVTGQAWVAQRFADGMTEIRSEKSGAATAYAIYNPEKMTSTSVKAKAVNVFFKAALAYGGLREALDLVGADIPTVDARKESLTPVQIASNELGEFPDTDEGKRSLRNAVRERLMAMRGEWVDCPALGAKVEIRRRGIDKALGASADARKLKLMPHIKSLIHSSIKVGERVPYNADEDKSAVAYYVLRVSARIDADAVVVRLIVKEDVNGKFHYDATVHDVNAVMDSAQDKGPGEAGPFLPLLPMAGEQNPSRFASDQLDSILEPGREYVNIFIEGDEPESVDEEGVVEPAPASTAVVDDEMPVGAPQTVAVTYTQQDADRALFQSVIDNRVSEVAPQLAEGILDPGLADLLEAAYLRHQGDADMAALFEAAVNAYAAAALAATANIGA
ncbi:MAG: hypothetical protein PHI49_06065 [Halothiobacillaceae bacterium]|nr:hypothetical protein [Halothiobacillaceae bacterium]